MDLGRKLLCQASSRRSLRATSPACCCENAQRLNPARPQDITLVCPAALSVCPRGTYEPAPNATSCPRCPKDAFCAGGDKTEQPLSRGSLTQCGPNLVTRNTGARTQTDCVAPAGFALTSPSAGAVPCSTSEYAPALNRLARCLRCQSGLAEPANSNLTDGQRASKRAVCSKCLLSWAPVKYATAF
jgi:hypothetical protein